MVNTEFNQQTGILESKFEGDVHLKQILDYIIATKENKNYPRKLKIITDASHANFTFSVSDLDRIVTENEKSLEKYESITDAIIVDDPMTTALSILFKELEKNVKYKFNIFSTKEASHNWLNQF